MEKTIATETETTTATSNPTAVTLEVYGFGRIDATATATTTTTTSTTTPPSSAGVAVLEEVDKLKEQTNPDGSTVTATAIGSLGPVGLAGAEGMVVAGDLNLAPVERLEPKLTALFSGKEISGVELYRRLPCARVHPTYFKSTDFIVRKVQQTATRLYLNSSGSIPSPIAGYDVGKNCIDLSRLCCHKAIHDTCVEANFVDEPLEKFYVLKVPRKQRNISIFNKELGLLCTMPPHKNVMGPPAFIVTTHVHQGGETNNVVIGYMTNLIKSGTLKTQMNVYHDDMKIVPLQTALSWSLQLVDAVIHLHRVVGIAHLALKPDNVLVDTTAPELGGRIILIDFEQTSTWPEYTSRVYDCLSLKYIDYSVIRWTNQYTEHSDVHALGCIIWELLEADTMLTYPRAQHFKDTPECLRKTLTECTSNRIRAIRPVALEVLRDVLQVSILQSQDQES